MKFRYSKEDDILMIELNKKPIDYAEQAGDLVTHFSSDRQAVLLEILDASKFLKMASKELPLKVRHQIFA